MFVRLNCGTWVNPKHVVGVYIDKVEKTTYVDYNIMIALTGHNLSIRETYPPLDHTTLPREPHLKQVAAENWAGQLITKFNQNG